MLLRNKRLRKLKTIFQNDYPVPPENIYDNFSYIRRFLIYLRTLTLTFFLIDIDDMILNNEIKNLFDNEILSKLSSANSNKNNIDITDQSKIREEQKNEQQSLEKNIKLYEDLLEEKKKNIK